MRHGVDPSKVDSLTRSSLHRSGRFVWLTTLGSAIVVTASLVAVLLIHSPPVVVMSQSFQIGVGTGVPVAANGSSSARPPIVLSTKLSRVIIVTPQQPVTDSDDQQSVDSDDGTQPTTTTTSSVGH